MWTVEYFQMEQRYSFGPTETLRKKSIIDEERK